MNGQATWLDGQSVLEVDLYGSGAALWIDGQSVIPGAKEAGSSTDQHSFIFFGDNGSEAGSSALGATNANILIAPGSRLRPRFLIDATGDPPARLLQLEFRRKPTGGSFGPWTKVE
mgnify:CR=1 FL=1